MRGTDAIAGFETLESRRIWSHIAIWIIFLHLGRKLSLRVSAGPRTSHLAASQRPERHGIIEHKSVHVRHVKRVRGLVLLLTWTQAACIADGGTHKVQTRLVVSLGEKVIFLVDVDGQTLGVDGLLRGTTLDVVRERNRTGDVVHYELSERHHHRG